MEHQKILNSLKEPNNSIFLLRKRNIANDQSNANYDVGNEIGYNREVLKSNFCNCNDAYILVKGDIVTTEYNIPTQLAFKNCAPFIKSITTIDGTTINDAEDLDLVMPITNQKEYSSNYSEATGDFSFCSKEANNFNADIANDNSFKSLKYKAELLGNTVPDGANGILEIATIAVPLKHLINF